MKKIELSFHDPVPGFPRAFTFNISESLQCANIALDSTLLYTCVFDKIIYRAVRILSHKFNCFPL